MYRLVYLVITVVFLSSCDIKTNVRSIKNIKKSGELNILSRTSSTTLYQDKEGNQIGFEYELASAFAKHLGVTPKFKSFSSVENVLNALGNGRGDFIAAGLTDTLKRRKRFSITNSYQEIKQKLICNKNFSGKSLADTKDSRLVVIKKSSYEENLNAKKKVNSELKWTPVSDVSTDQLISMVWNNQADCTVADSNILDVHIRYMPELKIIEDISETQKLAWFVDKDNSDLNIAINNWLSMPETKQLSKELQNKYYGYEKGFDYFDKKIFLSRYNKVFLKYKTYFKKAAAQVNIPWKLLAAISYQESHWDSRAISPTGVKGLMMLTQNTAREMRVLNRTDPVQSINGGAKYFKKITLRMPLFIIKEDRLKMALAAYNQGYGSLQDARKIAIDLRLNANKWEDIKKTLPLLSEKNYFENTRHGYARGLEAVVYVGRVLKYYKILKTQE